MPTRKIRAQLVPDSFHRELIQAMKNAGFLQLYRFRATTDHDAYYVPAQYAQETTHFFYLPDRGFLIQLALNEHIGERGAYECHWTGRAYLQLDTHEIIAYQVRFLCKDHKPKYFMDGCEPLEHIMYNVESLLLPFRESGGSSDDDLDSFRWQFEHIGHLPVSQLVAVADGLRTHFGPFLQPQLSCNFDAFGFTNTFAWPDIDDRFWGHFPTSLLKPMVPGRVRGRKSVRSLSRR